MAGVAAKSSAIVIPHKPAWHQRLAARAAWLLIRLVALTLRYRWIDRSGFFEGDRPDSTPMGTGKKDTQAADSSHSPREERTGRGLGRGVSRDSDSNPATPGPAIYCVWHNRLALCLISYFKYIHPRSPTEGLAAMVSASRDGALLTRVLECFGVQPVRGSSSRRGAQALRELTTWSRRGYDLAITPDGPRGPRYVVQDGIIALAQLTGKPIIPVSYHLGWKISVNSWDRFQVPLPFSRCDFFFEKPVRVPREASAPEREAARVKLEQTLNSISVD